MFKGFYTAAAGMLSQQRQTDLLTNNIANANTPGFKADQGTLKAFPDMLLQRMESEDLPTDRSISVQNKKDIGAINTGVYMQETVPNFTQGDLQQTSQSTDIALMEQNIPTKEGGLFFVVQSPDNTPQYTRNSNFTL
ncbi:flagellar hook-basal body complex protein, partial [Priestia megaterium]|uniref:flagellar hook-basal body complex protein n=2 Tax=Bacillaceae TaxID=186817 RepID=UPI002FFF4BC1